MLFERYFYLEQEGSGCAHSPSLGKPRRLLNPTRGSSVVAVTLASSALALVTPEPREPQLSILPVDGCESLLSQGIANLWEGLEEQLKWVEHLWSSDEIEIVCEEQLEKEDEEPRKKTAYEILSKDDKFSKFFFLVTHDPLSVAYLSRESGNFTLFAPTNAAFPAPSPHEFLLEFGNPLALETLHRYFSHNPNGRGWEHLAAVRILHALLQYHIIPKSAHPIFELAEFSTVATGLTVPGALLGAAQRINLSPALRPLPTIQLNFAGHIVAADLHASNGIVHGVSSALQPGLSAMDELYAVPWLFPFTRQQAPWVLGITASALEKTGLNKVVDHKPVFHRPGPFAVPAAHEDVQDGIDAAEEMWLNITAESLAPIPLPGLSWEGSPAVTVFAPTNKAWSLLPPRLSKWFHSPWGEFALDKLLKYHVINGTVLFADYVHPPIVPSLLRARDGIGPRPDFEDCGPADPVQDWTDWTVAIPTESSEETNMWPTYDYLLFLPTLLGKNFTLPVRISKDPLFPLPPPGQGREVAVYRMWAQGVPVAIRDVPVRNGVIQAVERVLNPLAGNHKEKRCHMGGVQEGGEAVEKQEVEDEWEGWEEWFVKWAMEALDEALV
ncbi:hypothetical protein DACRYDRAFT_105857 [Dacryopinax primogenitus]|uniref:FAS1 domain-containing protein n=1 Tax=Dacryopinax primogenitus (strain DJM 731) TaxID=1858805 RepID=M5G4X6_DACPD|nr:uncharacterized protein DACRYDRAFT_105857 [Dacryopinax primogenitus]EJU03699.1 hypothetical protein DACRYDRAFT_105857 [Dacryopinax primogenitus]